ncbi:MAG: saccharopine dehydrogenase NADP-binding domain-containing protein [Flavobacteriaceae bacterium]|nr:saccharopine dehydrogenase NADP-binding domain-containing protein [Flavobacteriaceae bacterium]
MSSIIVLGAGMVGSAMAIDLAKDHQVTVSDLNPDVLAKLQEKCTNLKTVTLDVKNEVALKNAIMPFDLVVCAVPGFLGSIP